MNLKQPSNSHKNGIAAAIGVVVLLIGTATGNAYVLLAMAILGLLVITILDRQWLRHNWLMAISAAAIAAVVSVAITKL